MKWYLQLKKELNELNKLNAKFGIKHEYEIVMINNNREYSLEQVINWFNEIKGLKSDFNKNAKIVNNQLIWNESYLVINYVWDIKVKEVR